MNIAAFKVFLVAFIFVAKDAASTQTMSDIKMTANMVTYLVPTIKSSLNLTFPKKKMVKSDPADNITRHAIFEIMRLAVLYMFFLTIISLNSSLPKNKARPSNVAPKEMFLYSSVCLFSLFLHHCIWKLV